MLGNTRTPKPTMSDQYRVGRFAIGCGLACVLIVFGGWFGHDYVSGDNGRREKQAELNFCTAAREATTCFLIIKETEQCRDGNGTFDDQVQCFKELIQRISSAPSSSSSSSSPPG